MSLKWLSHVMDFSDNIKYFHVHLIMLLSDSLAVSNTKDYLVADWHHLDLLGSALPTLSSIEMKWKRKRGNEQLGQLQ